MFRGDIAAPDGIVEAPDLLALSSTSVSVLSTIEAQPVPNWPAHGIVRTDWPQLLILGGLLLLLYGQICVKLVSDWHVLPDFSHGFLVPFFVLFILWEKRHVLLSTPRVPSWTGIFLVAAALFTLLMGVYGAELFFSRISLVLLLAGIVWTLYGVALLREIRFAFFVLCLGIPIPAVVFNQITFPLQLMASKAAGAILPLLGVPVLQQGNVIQLASMQLEVAEACSGIRSLLSLFAVAVLYGYLTEKTTRNRVILALASIPIAVLANMARITGTGLIVQYWDPEKALGFFHEFSGLLMFVVSLVCLELVRQLLAWMQAPKGQQA